MTTHDVIAAFLAGMGGYLLWSNCQLCGALEDTTNSLGALRNGVIVLASRVKDLEDALQDKGAEVK